MSTRFRIIVALISSLAVLGVVVPVAVAKPAAGIPKVTGLTAAGSNTSTGKLAVRWKKVAGATYQVRWAPSTAKLGAATLYATSATSATSPVLGNICTTWYAQVRARKGTKVGPWSSPRGLRFKTGSVTVPQAITSGQTSTQQVQVRWKRGVGLTGYRLQFSPGPFGNWPGYAPRTKPVASTATGININLPRIGSGDRFMNAAYGNPVFARIEGRKCDGSYAVARNSFVPVWPKAAPAGSARTGDELNFGTYNLQRFPTRVANPDKVRNLADNIASRGLDVVALQEANEATAANMIAQLKSTEGQLDWKAATGGNGVNVQQQILYRSGTYTQAASGVVGGPVDSSAATPKLTPWVRLNRVDPTPGAAPAYQQLMFVSVHLEDLGGGTVPQRKAAVHAAASTLVKQIDAVRPAGVPVLVAGDFQGNFGSGGPVGAGYCDESSTPRCSPEGQPTFIRNGYTDAQGAVTKRGVAYNTVNKNVANQPISSSGFGGRADFIVFKGMTGTSLYENVRRTYGNASSTQQSDHNLVWARFFVPFAP